MNNLLYKWNLYNLSLIPLYVIFILQYLKIEPILEWNTIRNINEYFARIFYENWQVIFFIFMITLALLSYVIFKNDSNYGEKNPRKFKNITAADFDHLTFLSTYIIPLITFDLTEPRSFIVVIFLLLMIGTIYVKSNLYYLNPTLLLFGYKIYRAKSDDRSVILICKGKITTIEKQLTYKNLGDNIYLIKEQECR